MRRSRVPRRKSASFRNAFILLFMLVVILLFATGLQRSGLPSNLATLVHGDYENFRYLEPFDSLKTLEVQAELAGFWTFAEGDAEASPVAKREYIELIDNGILWQVNEWFINAPSGGRNVVTQVKNGFVNPYSYNPANDAFYCETRIIRQFFVAGADTCYGASQVDEIWHVNKTADGALMVNNRGYRPFEGDIGEFFPDGGLLDIIDDINMRRCASATDMQFIAKRVLARSLEPVMFFIRAQTVNELVNAYYKPIVFDELALMHDPRTVPEVMNVRLTIAPDGSVSNVRHRPAGLMERQITRRFDERALMDMPGWLFPPVADSEEAQSVELSIRVR